MPTRSNRTHLLAPLILFLQGCAPSEGQLWGLGAFVFLIFVIIILLNTLVPIVQEYEIVRNWLIYVENIILKVFKYLVAISLILIALGFFIIVSNPKRSSNDLIIFIGALLLYFSINVKKWAVETDKQKKRNYVRTIGLCITFMLAMVWVMSGAPGLSL